MPRVFLKTYGCQMNERDSEAVEALLCRRGYEITRREKEADVILFNTCSVREKAEEKALGKAGHVLKRKRGERPELIVGVMGCMAQNRGADLLRLLPGTDLVAGTGQFHRVPDLLDRLTQKNKSSSRPVLVELGEARDNGNTLREHDWKKRRVSAFVSVMRGCGMQCSFCVVPKVRGSEICRPVHEIVSEVEDLVRHGTREVTLLGQIVTRYGRGVIPGKNGRGPFVQLLEAVSEVDGLARIRFTSPHPRGFKPDLIEAFGRLPKLCEHVHLPLQSGSDRILKAMNRPYTAAAYLNIVSRLREAVPHMRFSTDVMVGFPGETEEDFEQTRRLFEEAGFDMAYIFKYSPRPGTAAAELEDDVPDAVKEERNQILLEILEASSRKQNEALVGTVQEVLAEGPDRKGRGNLMGRTRGNRKVFFPADSNLMGQLVPVRIARATTAALHGAPVAA